MLPTRRCARGGGRDACRAARRARSVSPTSVAAWSGVARRTRGSDTPTAVIVRPARAASKASARIGEIRELGHGPDCTDMTPVLDSRGPSGATAEEPTRPTPPEGRTARIAPGPRTWNPTTARARLGRRSRFRAESRPGAGTLDGRAAADDHPGARGAGRAGRAPEAAVTADQAVAVVEEMAAAEAAEELAEEAIVADAVAEGARRRSGGGRGGLRASSRMKRSRRRRPRRRLEPMPSRPR